MKIALTSCSKVHSQKVQPVWNSIEQESPDLLLLLGDNVYGGTFTSRWKRYHRQLEERYQLQLEEKNFQSLTSTVPFKAIWDDHDFALVNDGRGSEIKSKHKNRSRELFHKYMNSSTNLPEVYYSFEQGNAKFIMLDGRYYREKASRTGSILGKKQEKWLQKQLNHNKKYTIICSGSCLTKGGDRWEKYKNYFKKFNKLAKNANNVLFLAGDIHKNRFVEHDGFFEVISSAVGRGNRNNYGIVDLKNNHVNIKLRGSKSSDNQDVRIDSGRWEVV